MVGKQKLRSVYVDWLYRDTVQLRGAAVPTHRPQRQIHIHMHSEVIHSILNELNFTKNLETFNLTHSTRSNATDKTMFKAHRLQLERRRTFTPCEPLISALRKQSADQYGCPS